MAVNTFTRFFEGKTVLLDRATPLFNSKKVPGHGDIIFGRNGCIIQVQKRGSRLVEVLIEGPPREIRLRPSWAIGPSII